MAVHRIQENYNQQEELSNLWAHLSNFWGPERTTPQTLKKLKIRMPNLQIYAYDAHFIVHLPPHFSGGLPPVYAVGRAVTTIREAYTRLMLKWHLVPQASPQAGRPPTDARLVFRGRHIRDDETFSQLHRSLSEINGNDDSWFAPLEIHVDFTEGAAREVSAAD